MKTPQPCGTDAAYRRHLRHGQVPCARCLDAHTVAARRYTGATPVIPQPCGTDAGYKRHGRRGQRACPACLAAHAAAARLRTREEKAS